MIHNFVDYEIEYDQSPTKSGYCGVRSCNRVSPFANSCNMEQRACSMNV